MGHTKRYNLITKYIYLFIYLFIYLAENRLKSAKVRWFLESKVNFGLGQVTQISCNESGKNLS